MSPRGHPDWKIPTGVLSSVEIEASELAVRTGFPDAFEGLGKVIFFELFGTDIGGWEQIGSGTFNGASLQTNRYYWKPASVRVEPGTTLNEESEIQRAAPLLPSRTMGLAVLFAVTTDDVDIQLRLDIHDATNPDRYRVRVIGSGGSIAVLDNASVYQELTTVGNLGSQARDWNYLKMIIDIENRAYKTVQFNDTRLDASAHAPPTFSQSLPDHIIFSLYATDDTGNGEQAYFDFVVLSIDDP